MRVITFDIETTGELQGGVFSIENQELTLVGVHDSHSGELSSYVKDELPKLWPLLESADMLVGFNSDHFDIPILNKYYAGNLATIKSVDLLKEVKNVLGRRIKLDNLTEATLGRKKSGSGLDAVKWWAEGQIEKVRQYCLEDVRLTRELYDYARTHGHLKYKDFDVSAQDGVRDIKLDTSGWEKPSDQGPALTHTLPF